MMTTKDSAQAPGLDLANAIIDLAERADRETLVHLYGATLVAIELAEAVAELPVTVFGPAVEAASAKRRAALRADIMRRLTD